MSHYLFESHGSWASQANTFAARTGSYVLCVWGPSALDNRVYPGYVATAGAEQFCIQTFDKPLEDIVRHMGAWGITKGDKSE